MEDGYSIWNPTSKNAFEGPVALKPLWDSMVKTEAKQEFKTRFQLSVEIKDTAIL